MLQFSVEHGLVIAGELLVIGTTGRLSQLQISIMEPSGS